MCQTLIIEKVDFDLLEQQRATLQKVVEDGTISQLDRERLRGLMNMLNDWSDERYHNEHS